MEKTVSVIIVDDHKIFRMGLGMMVNNIPHAKLLGEASDSKHLLSLLKEVQPTIIFMDVYLGEESGVELTRKVLTKYPNIKIIAMTSSDEVKHFTEMMEYGASGFMLKNVAEQDMDEALRELSAGHKYFSKEFKSLAQSLNLVQQKNKVAVNLSDREKQVLDLVCHGYSNQEVADALKLSYHTIDSYRRTILQKTNARNTAEMIRVAVQLGLIS